MSSSHNNNLFTFSLQPHIVFVPICKQRYNFQRFASQSIFFSASVRLGEHDLSTDTDTQHVDIPVLKVIQHPAYDKKDGHSDLAILVLAGEIPFSSECQLKSKCCDI